MEQNLNEQLLDFIAESPSVYHVIDNFAGMLEAAGYTRLRERERWTLVPGGKYYVTRAGSSMIAFRVPKTESWTGFRLSAAHGDSPTFKLKAEPELAGNGYLRLNTEKYGGMLMATWFDRPLSVAGRVLVKEDGKLVSRLVDLDRDLLVIPSVAIHMNRNANDGTKLLANVDTVPLLGGAADAGRLKTMVAEAAGTAPERIAAEDLYLCCREKGTVLGAEGEYLLSPKLDDLECAWGCMRGFLDGERADSTAVPVCCIFNNEEVGSETKQGAGSSFLRDTLRRICLGCGKDEADFMALLAGSFLVSADNAHAVHPNHPEKTDAANCCWLNHGIVVKENAAQKYTTDAFSRAVFTELCRKAEVPVQLFANRSDSAGGSTLGNLSNTQVSLHAVDIGLPQLAMHSAYETAGSRDTQYAVEALRAYYGTLIRIDESESAAFEG